MADWYTVPGVSHPLWLTEEQAAIANGVLVDPPADWPDGSPLDAATAGWMSDDGSDLAAATQARIAAAGVNEIMLAFPTGSAATDDAALSNAITAATSAFVLSGAVIVARPGTYLLSTFHNIPDGVDLRGQGGGSTSRRGRTIFKCTTAAAGISISGGGGPCLGFEIDGNSTANTPFMRLGGTGANARLFQNITVHANTGSGNDLALFYGAQNDAWFQCGFADSSRDLGVFDQGYGGAAFFRCEWRTAARYHHRYDNAVSGGVYPVPTDNKHIGGIMEGGAGTSMVKSVASTNCTYDNHAFYSVTAPTGPMIDVVSGTNFALHSPWIQCTNAIVTGTVGIMARGTSTVTVSGRAVIQNVDTALEVDGAGAFIYGKCNWQFYSVNTNLGAINGGTVAQIADLQTGNRLVIGASTDYAEISQPPSRDRFLFSRTQAGVLSWYSGGATFTPDVQILRRAAGAVGVINGTQQVICTGVGTTAQRPAAAAALVGALYINTDTAMLEACVNSTTWAGAQIHTWVNATTAGITTNPSGSGAPVGYTKIGGVVHLRGLAGSVTIGSTVLFTLPAGFRPAYQTNIPVLTINGSSVVTAGYVSIATNGNVTVPAGAGALVSFEGVSFPAEA